MGMINKDEALKLAHLMIDVTDCETSEFYRAAQMIRKLVEELDRLVGAEPITHGKLTFCKNCGQQDPYTQTKPLSDEEIKAIATQNRTDLTVPAYISFARAIEERHGIK